MLFFWPWIKTPAQQPRESFTCWRHFELVRLLHPRRLPPGLCVLVKGMLLVTGTHFPPGNALLNVLYKVLFVW